MSQACSWATVACFRTCFSAATLLPAGRRTPSGPAPPGSIPRPVFPPPCPPPLVIRSSCSVLTTIRSPSPSSAALLAFPPTPAHRASSRSPSTRKGPSPTSRSPRREPRRTCSPLTSRRTCPTPRHGSTAGGILGSLRHSPCATTPCRPRADASTSPPTRRATPTATGSRTRWSGSSTGPPRTSPTPTATGSPTDWRPSRGYAPSSA